jgi:hypothetical protein
VATRKGTSTGNATPEGGASTGAPDANGHPQRTATRSGPIAAAGVQTGEDFANLMSALMSDVIEGTITPIVANATVNAGGKLLKVVEMQYRYGAPKDQRPMTLTLAPGK